MKLKKILTILENNITQIFSDNWYINEYQNITINVSTKIEIVGKGNVVGGANEKN